jgi:lysophospholipase L1-like esterase
MRVLCYGDSNTVGFCQKGRHYQPYGQTLSEALSAAGSPCEVTACGLCGFTAKEMDDEKFSAYLQTQIGPCGKGMLRILEDDGPFDLVIIMAGTNDIGCHRSYDATQVHVARLHAACHDCGIPTVNLVPLAPVTQPKLRRARERLADLMGDWANATPDVLLNLDVEQLVPRSVTRDYEPDGIHFSASGSKALGRLLAAKIGGILGQLSVPLVRSCSPDCRSRSPTMRPLAMHAAEEGDTSSPGMADKMAEGVAVTLKMRSVSPVKQRRASVNFLEGNAVPLKGRGVATLKVLPERSICASTGRSIMPVSVLSEKKSEHVVTSHSFPQEALLQESKLMERAVIKLQKMMRNRVLHQQSTSLKVKREKYSKDHLVQHSAVSVQKVQRKRVLGQNVTVQNLQSMDKGRRRAQAPSRVASFAACRTSAVPIKVQQLTSLAGCVV